MSVPVQIIFSAVWLVAYLLMSLRYQRVWDARMRGALGRRLNTRVGWSKVDISEAALTDDSDAPVMAWHADSDGPLLRQLGQGLLVRAAYLAVIVLLGAVPPLALIGLQVLLGFHGLVVLASLVPVIAIFSLFWVGTYRQAE
ncbi:hypothetical protein Rhe02_17660 [Rhizocola hellebori]|uniref:Uncharacterized protein n=1 Tax=Rhizocola hellebori TaxID=1392758 RepID=A0A8J3VDM7_9ACTN|nr:hypothetical protein Rhe02_17660 [Rhizocola hellebori]